MARIEVEESDLESIKAMAQRLQQERDELITSLADFVEALSHIEERMAMRVNPPTLSNARSLLARYTTTPKVME